MDKWEISKKLMRCFPNSFVNYQGEFIAHREANSYFILDNCKDELEVKCKVIAWFSRDAHKTSPFGARKNKEFHKFMLDGINKFLGSDFTEKDMELIYTYLGNDVNRKLCVQFIESGFDMSVLQNKPKFFSKTQEEYIEHTSRCANCIHSKGIEKGYVYCYNSYKNNYPYAIDNSVECKKYKQRSEDNA